MLAEGHLQSTHSNEVAACSTINSDSGWRMVRCKRNTGQGRIKKNPPVKETERDKEVEDKGYYDILRKMQGEVIKSVRFAREDDIHEFETERERETRQDRRQQYWNRRRRRLSQQRRKERKNCQEVAENLDQIEKKLAIIKERLSRALEKFSTQAVAGDEEEKPPFTQKTMEESQLETESELEEKTVALEEMSLGDSVKRVESSVKINNNCRTVRFLHTNMRGFASKSEILRKIMINNQCDIAFINETHCNDDKPPRIKGYNVYYRNRVAKRMGGVAIAVHENIDHGAVRIEAGEGDNEFLAVKIETFNPPLVAIAMYGQQENQHSEEVIRAHIAEVVERAKFYSNEGCTVVWAGDINVKVGCEKSGLSNNEPTVSKGGKFLLEALDDTALEICNDLYAGIGHTHIDATAGTSRVLDLIMSNEKDNITELVVDEKQDFTPYRVKVSRDKATLGERRYHRTYSDHRSVKFTMKLSVRDGVKKANKMTNWRFGRPGGREDYYQKTGDIADDIIGLVNPLAESDINKVMEVIERMLIQTKDDAYGRSTITKKKKERIEDEEVWSKRVEMLMSHLEGLEGEKLTDKIYKTVRKIGSEGRTSQVTAVKDPDTGKTLQTRDEVFQRVLDYNVGILSKTEATGEWKEIADVKREMTEEMKRIETEEDRHPFSLDEFIAVVEKVARDKKAVYNDFMWAHPKFKLAILLLFNRIYIREEVPEVFNDTMLMPLFKGKGSRAELTNHRFLHLKGWAPKLFEKLLMQRVERKIHRATPDLQQGGQPEGSTVDHLLTVVTLLNIRARKKEVTVLTLMDIVKCFDQVKLEDILYEFTQAGIKGKDLRMIEKINQNTRISIQGDVDKERSAIIQNSVGQGTTGAVQGSALVIATTAEKNFKKSDHNIVEGEVEVLPTGFVDDLGTMRGSAEGVRDAGLLLTKTVDELSLRAHPGKTVNLIFGPKKKKEKIRAELKEEPMTIQGAQIKEVGEDAYLGMVFHSGGVKESVDRSIEVRRAKALVKTRQAKQILKDHRIQSVGWLDAARALYQGTILPTLTYSAIAWVNMNKKQVARLESTQKECIYTLLELLPSAKYTAVLLEFGLPRIEHFVNQLKINYLSKLLYGKPGSIVARLVMEEDVQHPGQGIVGEVRRLCQLYRLTDGTQTLLDHDRVKDVVTRTAMIELWEDVRKSSKIPLRREYQKQRKEYFKAPKMPAKATFMMNVGELNFKTNRRKESIKKFGNIECPVESCLSPDSLVHAAYECLGYKTRFPDGVTEGEIGQYLLQLHAERVQRWSLPLLPTLM